MEKRTLTRTLRIAAEASPRPPAGTTILCKEDRPNQNMVESALYEQVRKMDLEIGVFDNLAGHSMDIQQFCVIELYLPMSSILTIAAIGGMCRAIQEAASIKSRTASNPYSLPPHLLLDGKTLYHLYAWDSGSWAMVPPNLVELLVAGAVAQGDM